MRSSGVRSVEGWVLFPWMPRIGESFGMGVGWRGGFVGGGGGGGSLADLKKSLIVLDWVVLPFTGGLSDVERVGVGGIIDCVDGGNGAGVVVLTRFQITSPGVMERKNLHIPHLESHSNNSLHRSANICTSGLFHSGLYSRIRASGEMTGCV